MYDVIIVGNGPAGLSASLYTTRANLKTLIVSNNHSALLKANKIDNYFGFGDTVSGAHLIEESIKQTTRLGTTIVYDDVLEISQNYDSEKPEYMVRSTNNEFVSNAILIAVGKPVAKVKIKGIKEFEGKGISYCSTCDGFFYKNKKVGVLGNKDFAVHEAMELENFSDDITIFTNGLEPDFSDSYIEQSKRFNIVTTPIESVVGDDVLKSVVFKDEQTFDIDGLFVAVATASGVNFAKTLGIMTDEDSIVVDDQQATNLPGIFAAGDCTGAFKQVSVSVGQGALAGRSIIAYNKELKNTETK